ncbi:hypothetical protein [Spirosoma pollinicola]|uniref:hypothetical protein n=1 Tax=Spirosoma pollinicola TaxID=2057025 RepID=UPI0012FDD48E|nr:hypothetical protein [Spirosoma pollinicola]
MGLHQLGAKVSKGMPMSVELVDSDLRVYIRLSLREVIIDKDRLHQTAAFTDIRSGCCEFVSAPGIG